MARASWGRGGLGARVARGSRVGGRRWLDAQWFVVRGGLEEPGGQGVGSGLRGGGANGMS